ncbi:MAG: hypothetical protein JSS95_00565 [Acidobacteria bacterium]|nr:hypothetical protein [Acidobacteriota bacterium]
MPNDQAEGTQVRCTGSMQSYLRYERIFVTVFLLFACATLGHFSHESYYIYSTDHHVSLFEAPKVLYAPEAYRVAIPWLGRLVAHVVPGLDSSVIYAAIGVLFIFPALYLFYLLAVKDIAVERSIYGRVAAVALFLAFIQFPLTWVVPWQRPETLPNTFYLAGVLWLLSKQTRGVLPIVSLLVLTLWQSFVRADIPFVFGTALALGSMFGDAFADFGSRRSNLLTGGAIAALAVTIQLYLQRIRFPHLEYPPDTAVVQLWRNVTPHGIVGFALAMMPVALVVLILQVKRVRVTAFDSLVLVASGLYLPLWLTVGIVSEVRIFVPFLFAVCAVGARLGAATAINAIEGHG